ncbi:hypothetical protein [Sanyastnella coralliicola]|uniref:hypothetical protein n=1 Tax=Sanyastnella coralliicola TaxID=3069118 RepID=UPI0027BABBAF|nr:hypothetical protein [Longitalea sp. SCSIO 12813]
MKYTLMIFMLALTLSTTAQTKQAYYTLDGSESCIENMQTTNENAIRSLAMEDLGLTLDQMFAVERLNNETTRRILQIEDQYRLNDQIYDNRVKLILAERDAKLYDLLTMDQYAVYMESMMNDLAYDYEYEDDDLSIDFEGQKCVKVKSEAGKISMDQDKIVIKNDLAQTKTEISTNELKYKDELADYTLTIAPDEVETSSPSKTIVVEDDSAELETEEKEIEVDVPDSE